MTGSPWPHGVHSKQGNLGRELAPYLGAAAPAGTRARETRDLKGSFGPGSGSGSGSRQVTFMPELKEKDDGARRGLTQPLVFPESEGRAGWDQVIPG